MLFVDWLIQSVSQILVTGTAWPRLCRDYAVPVTEAIALQNGKTRASKTYFQSIVLEQSILQLESNFETPDLETAELINDSEYLQRVEMLWGDSAEWL